MSESTMLRSPAEDQEHRVIIIRPLAHEWGSVVSRVCTLLTGYSRARPRGDHGVGSGKAPDARVGVDRAHRRRNALDSRRRVVPGCVCACVCVCECACVRLRVRTDVRACQVLVCLPSGLSGYSQGTLRVPTPRDDRDTAAAGAGCVSRAGATGVCVCVCVCVCLCVRRCVCLFVRTPHPPEVCGVLCEVDPAVHRELHDLRSGGHRRGRRHDDRHLLHRETYTYICCTDIYIHIYIYIYIYICL
jgi:hypothetical protein